LAALDRAFAAWIASEPTDTDLINTVIKYIGIAFGQALVDGIGHDRASSRDITGDPEASF
jgi:class 3 adenylate cyclase